jgi:hypothetical protein
VQRPEAQARVLARGTRVRASCALAWAGLYWRQQQQQQYRDSLLRHGAQRSQPGTTILGLRTRFSYLAI